ncbi:LysR family transcriptional regulator [Pantoea ananatis]|uniref:LysR family transcriptional regulator n=1 Tax=Pantoea ananas TaxID=553 RepID=UPI00051DF496|nr:LysR family transcriptional regulator [Pantoea ananatis]KGL57299.1 hypothetical protein KR94_06100 [Pantoea ananatis]MCW0332955.1 hypothetical protein [Pantoea ananatis]
MKNKKNALIFDWIIYIKVVEKKSFSAAARELMMSVATVSKVIAKLEDIFSARLIIRNAHKFEVTSSGQTAYEKALLMCETYHNLLYRLECKDEIRGELRLSAPGIMCGNIINDWIIEYTDRHPRAKVRLLSRETGSFSSDSPAFDDLVIKSEQLDSPDLIQKKLNPVQFGMYASPEYLRKNGEPKRPEDLSGHSLLRLSHYSLRNPVAFRSGETVISLCIDSEEEFHSNSIQSLLHMTLHDRGICLAVPCWIIGHYNFDQRLFRVLPDWELTPLPVFMMWRYRKHYSALFNDFSSFIEGKWNCIFSDAGDFVE